MWRGPAGFVVLLLSAFPCLAEQTAAQTLPPTKEPFAAPEFVLGDIDGNTHRMSDYRGQVVVLNFWATWCPPCREEMPSMERAWQKVRGTGIVILAVNVGEDEDTIFEFTGNYPVSFPLLMDREAGVIGEYRVVGLPTTYIVSPEGLVTHKTVGTREWDDEALLDELRAMRPN